MNRPPTAIEIARLHHQEMLKLIDKVRINSNCIGHLLIGRKVRRLRETREFTITEVRLGLAGQTGIYGKANGSKATRPTHLGTVNDIEVIEP